MTMDFASHDHRRNIFASKHVTRRNDIRHIVRKPRIRSNEINIPQFASSQQVAGCGQQRRGRRSSAVYLISDETNRIGGAWSVGTVKKASRKGVSFTYRAKRREETGKERCEFIATISIYYGKLLDSTFLHSCPRINIPKFFQTHPPILNVYDIYTMAKFKQLSTSRRSDEF